MTSLLSALAVSALTHIISPNATLTLSQTSGAMLVAVSGADLAQVALDTPVSYLYALPTQVLGEVKRGLQLRSPADLALYAAPFGALVWDSSPTLREVTHKAGALIHQLFTLLRDAISRFLAHQVSPSGTISPSSSLSPPSFYLDQYANASSLVDTIPRSVYGPEWEWFPRDLVVFTPQPSCPVPAVRSNMSTHSTLDHCGLGSQDYYAEIARSTMRGRSSIMPSLGWCGRGSEEHHAEVNRAGLWRQVQHLDLKELARQKRLDTKVVRQREPVRAGSMRQRPGAWRPVLFCFVMLALVHELLAVIFLNLSQLRIATYIIIQTIISPLFGKHVSTIVPIDYLVCRPTWNRLPLALDSVTDAIVPPSPRLASQILTSGVHAAPQPTQIHPRIQDPVKFFVPWLFKAKPPPLLDLLDYYTPELFDREPEDTSEDPLVDLQRWIEEEKLYAAKEKAMDEAFAQLERDEREREDQMRREEAEFAEYERRLALENLLVDCRWATAEARWRKLESEDVSPVLVRQTQPQACVSERPMELGGGDVAVVNLEGVGRKDEGVGVKRGGRSDKIIGKGGTNEEGRGDKPGENRVGYWRHKKRAPRGA